MRLFVLLAFLAFAPGPVTAASRDEAFAALARRDYETALPLLMPLAEQGDALAQYGVGSILDGGFGNPDAEAVLGTMYRRGEGVVQDDVEALRWNARAAAKGQPMAQLQLGWAYGDGRGVMRDAMRVGKPMPKSPHGHPAIS